MSEINTNNDLDEVFEETMDDSTVITVPIDETLTRSGEAADAAAVGEALALKADAADINTIKVNAEEADNQGQIYINGTGIPMSGTDETTLQEAIEAEQGKTGADIPLSDEEDAETIGEAIEELQGRTGATIPLSSLLGAPTIAEAVAAAGTVKSVNGETPDNGNVKLEKVPLADNLDSTQKQTSQGEFTVRMAGGSASLSDGPANLLRVLGNTVRTGHTDESLDLTVNSDSCEASVTDLDTFRTAMGDSGTLTLSYTGSWSEDPADYGITVTGTPENGDSIVIVWVKEVAGTITNANPTGFSVTGWNLYSQTAGYARVVRYSDDYGYAISGSYTALAFSQTETGTRSAITPGAGGLFQVPSDGFLWVTGGGSDTAVWATWSDWANGYQGDFEAYSKTTISLATIMNTLFPDGLCSVGNVRDYIDIAGGNAYQWIDILDNTPENMAVAEASGRPYTYDETDIYLTRASADVTALSGVLAINGNYTVNGHGLEMFEGSTVPVGALTSYSVDLRNKLERDVLTVSQQTLTDAQKEQARSNIGAISETECRAGSIEQANNVVGGRIQMGYITSGSVPSGGVLAINLTFPKAFTKTPFIMASVNSQANGYIVYIFRIINVSKTGAKIEVASNHSAAVSLSNSRRVNWIAFEP